METAIYVVCGVWIVGAAVAVLVMAYAEKQRQPNSIIDLPREISDWLADNNYQLRVSENTVHRRGVISGPFAGKVSYGQEVYRVVISEQGSEKRRVAWIRFGEDIWHTTDQMTVIWDDEWRPPEPPIG